VLVRLVAPGVVDRIEVDTNHFKGNYPDTCSLEGCHAPGATVAELSGSRRPWTEVLARTKLQAHTRHLYRAELTARGPFTHLRLNVYPDGGVSRLRVHGRLDADGRVGAGLRRLRTMLDGELQVGLEACCGSHVWARAMVKARPFGSREELMQAADRVWAGLDADDWLKAFRAHPRIGERKADATQGATAQSWSTEEQSGTRGAAAATMAALAEGNRRYEERFGFIYIVCATGRSADEMLALLRDRLESSRDVELKAAAEEQRKITALRLDRLIGA
jgi:allantoicase